VSADGSSLVLHLTGTGSYKIVMECYCTFESLFIRCVSLGKILNLPALLHPVLCSTQEYLASISIDCWYWSTYVATIFDPVFLCGYADLRC
jgi:hypothetical protein